MSSPVAGWYTDPVDSTLARWWDGTTWTNNVRDHPNNAESTSAPQALVARAPDPPAPGAPSALVTEPAATRSPTLTDAEPAPSIGAALLPPLPKASDTSWDAQRPIASVLDQPKSQGGGRGLLVMLVAVLIIVAVGAGTYFSGALDGVLDRHAAREPSSDAVQVFAGDGYSFEVPRDWEKKSPSNPNVLAEYRAPDGVEIAFTRTERNEQLPDQIDLSAAPQQFAGSTAQYPGVKVISQVPSALGDIPGVRVILEGAVFGQPLRLLFDGTVIDKQVWIVGMAGPPDAVTSDVPTYDQILKSFRLE
jgi:hypothetical protein